MPVSDNEPVSDKMLMAYADGAVNAQMRTQIEAYLQTDPAARRRVEIFRKTGAPLSELYGQPMREPVPAALKDFVLNYPLDTQASKASSQNKGRVGLLSRFRKGAGLASLGRLLEMPAPARHWQLAAASAAFLVLGIGIGAFLPGKSGASNLVAFQDGRIYANGALRDVLEKELSGREARIGGTRGEAVTMRASLTFRSKQNSFCREYEIATPDNGGFIGLGCRDRNGRWALEAQLPANRTSQGGGTKTASGPGNAALDVIVDDMIDGDALGSNQEAAEIGKGWK